MRFTLLTVLSGFKVYVDASRLATNTHIPGATFNKKVKNKPAITKKIIQPIYSPKNRSSKFTRYRRSVARVIAV